MFRLLQGLRYNITYPSYLGAQFDASTTNLSYSIPCWTGEANPVEITLSFLSPITPTSTLRQSIPAAYLSVHVKGTFDVDIYVDLNGQWVSGDRGSQITWDLGWFLKDEKHHQRRPVLKTWKVKRETEQLFTEYGDQAEWGSLYFSAPMVRTPASWHVNCILTIIFSAGHASRGRGFCCITTEVRKDRHAPRPHRSLLSQHYG